MRRNQLDANGNEILRCVGGRNFTYKGKKYFINGNIWPKGHRGKKEKYFICLVKEDGKLEPLYHRIGWDMAQCDTIAEGRRIVAWDDWELSTWDGGEACESND